MDNTIRGYEIHVACHELLGHGVGKLTYREKDKPTPSWTDPVTGEQFEGCYEEGETWTSKFGVLSSSYEECRADTAGLFLCTLPEVYTLFDIQADELKTLLFTNYFNEVRGGILGLQFYNVETKKWGQAHTQGGFVILQFLYQNQKSDIVRVELDEQKDELFLHLNIENLWTEGRELISKLLVCLQTYKTSASLEKA